MSTKELPQNFGVLLFPAFQALDVFGPLDTLNLLSYQYPMNLSIISSTLDPVSTKPLVAIRNSSNSNFSESIVPTHTFETAPPLDVLLVPGGYGVRNEETIQPAIDFLKKVYPSLKYLITVCTGSWIAARAGVLDGKRATSNKAAWSDTKKLGNGVDWVSHARWVVDGNIWTSSGVSAGIDVTLAFIAEVFDKEVAEGIAKLIEYDWHRDSSWDPFADMYNL